MIEAIANALRTARIRATREIGLQDALGAALQAAALSFEREVQLGSSNRIDFLVGDIGVEVKVAGSRGEVVRQLQRYALVERIAGLVLVTTCLRHAHLPDTLANKPLRVVHLFGGSL